MEQDETGTPVRSGLFLCQAGWVTYNTGKAWRPSFFYGMVKQWARLLQDKQLHANKQGEEHGKSGDNILGNEAPGAHRSWVVIQSCSISILKGAPGGGLLECHSTSGTSRDQWKPEECIGQAFRCTEGPGNYISDSKLKQIDQA